MKFLQLWRNLGTSYMISLDHQEEDEDDLITMSNEEEFQKALKNVSDGLPRIFVKRSI